MPELPASTLAHYRAQTFRTAPGLSLRTPEDALAFANQRGFLFFWPIKEVLLPSLWAAVAGDRPVPNNHDDPGHVTWDWKDRLLSQRHWYYARILRRRNTILSLEMAPTFYALSENFGSPEEDYLEQYRAGRLTMEARVIFETLLDQGAMDTVALRKAVRMTSRDSDTRFNRAMDDLQRDFRILPIGIREAGAWRYAFLYEATHRYYPDLVHQAGQITEAAAREMLVLRYLEGVGTARPVDITRLFGWPKEMVERVTRRLAEAGRLASEVQVEGQADSFLAHPAVFA